MKNVERQGKDILAQECMTGGWAIYKNTMEIMPCGGNLCSECLFEGFPDSQICKKNKSDWLNAEYKPKREFSEEDRAVLKALPKIEWVTREKGGMVYGHLRKPYRRHAGWDSQGYGVNLSVLVSAQFLPISFDDDEPTSRAEILGEE